MTNRQQIAYVITSITYVNNKLYYWSYVTLRTKQFRPISVHRDQSVTHDKSGCYQMQFPIIADYY
jgi:hypothetical protein